MFPCVSVGHLTLVPCSSQGQNRHSFALLKGFCCDQLLRLGRFLFSDHYRLLGTHSPLHSYPDSQSRSRTHDVPDCQIDISSQAMSPADAADSTNPCLSVQCCCLLLIACFLPCALAARRSRRKDLVQESTDPPLPAPGIYQEDETGRTSIGGDLCCIAREFLSTESNARSRKTVDAQRR